LRRYAIFGVAPIVQSIFQKRQPQSGGPARGKGRPWAEFQEGCDVVHGRSSILEEWHNLPILLRHARIVASGRVSEIVEAYKRGLAPPATFSPERQG
jgi:hypothetical protein